MRFQRRLLTGHRNCLGVCVAGTIALVAGCTDFKSEPDPRAAAPAAAIDHSRAEKPSEARLAVKPGTLLSEAGFNRTLLETGAKYIVLQVFQESCGPCMTEALVLTEKARAWRKAGIAILGLGMDETADGPRQFHEHTGERITYPLYLAPWFAEQQQVLLTPTVFIYSAAGKQLFRTDPESAEDGIMKALEDQFARFQTLPSDATAETSPE